MNGSNTSMTKERLEEKTTKEAMNEQERETDRQWIMYERRKKN